MAAERKSFLRKSDSLENGSVKKHRSGCYDMEVDESYNFHATRSAKELFLGGKEEREEGEVCFEHGEADTGEVLSPPGKKKKISPVVWDVAEEEKYYENDVEDEDEYVENKVKGWNITMSRWASDGVSPMSTDDKSKGLKAISSVEINEFQRETSGSTITRSSGSCGRDNCVGHSTSDSASDKEFCSDSMCDVGEQSDPCDSPDYVEDSGLVDGRTERNMFPSCRSICEFEMIKKINEGTYGVVYKARDKKTGEIVAIKKVKMNISRDGFPVSALREMNILLSFNHPSIVDVKEVAVDDYDGTFMVMEYMEHDLKELMKVKKQPFSVGEIKSMMKQLLEGVKYIHDNWVMHRDLKTSNILLNKEGRLKICDFGLSRQYGSPLKPYTPVVVTLWYRAPELLLGAKEYSTAIDMWSVGCIMAELISKEALFSGKSEVEQLDKIVRTLGTPDENSWAGFSKLPGSKGKFVKQPYSILRRKFRASSFIGLPVLSEAGFDLLEKLLTYDPEKRITAEDALLHDWFHEAPLPKSDFKPILPSWRC